MKSKIAFALLVSVCLMLFAGCNNEPKTLYQSDSVKIIREDNKTAIYDLLSNKEYNYITVRVKRSQSVTGNHTSVDTETIKIETLAHGGLRVYDKAQNKIFTYQRKSLHNKG